MVKCVAAEVATNARCFGSIMVARVGEGLAVTGRESRPRLGDSRDSGWAGWAAGAVRRQLRVGFARVL